MWYVRDVLHAVLHVRFSCFVMRGCGVSRRYIDVCYCDMYNVVNAYLDHLKFCVVCIDSRRNVCCSECDVVSNECNEPTSSLVRPIDAHCCEVMYLGCFGFRGELGFLNCDDVCMCVLNKQFELLEFVSESVYVDLQYDEISLTFTAGPVCLFWPQKQPLYKHNINSTIAIGFNQNKPPEHTITVAQDISKTFDTVNIHKRCYGSGLPSETYRMDEVTPIFRSFLKTASFSTGD